MKKGIFLIFCMIFSVFSLAAIKEGSIKESKILEGVNFFQDGEISNLVLKFDSSGAKVTSFQVSEDKQIILDLKGVTATDRVIRAFDTSEFSGSMVFVSAYRKNTNDLRIVLQLRDNVRSILKKIDNKVILSIENRFGVFSQQEVASQDIEGRKLNDNKLDHFHVPKSNSVQDILENITLSGKKKYVGTKISFNVKDMPVVDLLKVIADISGFNIITVPEVKTKRPMTLKLTNIPWDHALDLILELNRLVARKKGEILLVTTLEQATKEEEENLRAKKLAIEKEPLLTRIFPVSYSALANVSKIITPYLTKDKGKVSQDERTNTLIIKDSAEVLERIVKIIEAIDTQTPQVLISAKIVEISESFSREIGLQNGVNWAYDPFVNTSNIENAGPGFTFSTAPDSASNRSLMGLSIATFGRVSGLNFSLQLMESESKGKIISSPKIITQNKMPATITNNEQTSYQKTTTAEGITTTDFGTVNANITLAVTPQVTNEGSIVLKINVSKSSFGTRPTNEAPPNTTTRNINTNVLVDNGSTIVIGGIYSFSTTEYNAGIPFLKDLPLIGWIFRTAYNPNYDKSEMVVFLTPRIINQEEAGLTGKNENI